MVIGHISVEKRYNPVTVSPCWAKDAAFLSAPEIKKPIPDTVTNQQ